MQKYIIFGGTGFIGSHFCNQLLNEGDSQITLVSRSKLKKNFWLYTNKKFIDVRHFQCDLKNPTQITNVLQAVLPDKIIFCAGENPSIIKKANDIFISNNIINVFNFLNCCLQYYKSLNSNKKNNFKILNVTTYEIYSSSNNSELEIISPKTIYSASKASALHLFNAWNATYELPITNVICANNYGENQSIDKLIPLTLNNLLLNNPILLFNGGECKRNWIHVKDTARALSLIIKNKCNRMYYKIGSENGLTNKYLVSLIINIFSDLKNEPIEHLYNLVKITSTPTQKAYSHQCDYEAIKQDFNWSPKISLENGLRTTIQYYINNKI